MWTTVHTAAGSIRIASLHAPYTKEDRKPYWEWWDLQIDGEDCVLAGDFNYVELPEDSKSKSPLISRAEEQAWKRLVNRTDMIDMYWTTIRTEGRLYTRVAFCGERLDQARLDHFYLTNNCEWCEVVKKVVHFSGLLLSDHIPIGLELQLTQEDDANSKPRGYFKMDNYLLEKPGVLEKSEVAWREHPPIQLETDDESDELLQRLRTIKIELRKWEIKEAKAWKVRSKERWLKEGKPPPGIFMHNYRPSSQGRK
ncbi:hypothetical protein R1sor_002732 [Riccia sorocarpa]|uniref:Endonuclease/exonuclease/phosphatase domain-containing protein n=1 Tax=Riccia sorocarpa TaxID=122646 RepID=A0ABD3H2S7_9MARC